MEPSRSRAPGHLFQYRHREGSDLTCQREYWGAVPNLTRLGLDAVLAHSCSAGGIFASVLSSVGRMFWVVPCMSSLSPEDIYAREVYG